jgi:hypothetical protein
MNRADLLLGRFRRIGRRDARVRGQRCRRLTERCLRDRRGFRLSLMRRTRDTDATSHDERREQCLEGGKLGPHGWREDLRSPCRRSTALSSVRSTQRA